jgi:uncharacterized protein (DUF2384 family)
MAKANSIEAQFQSVLDGTPLDVEQLRAWLGLTQSEIGAIVGRDRRSVARWAEDANTRTSARGDAARALRRLARVQFLLGDLTDAQESRRWLRAPSAALRGEAPIDLLENGRIDEVIAVLETLADGGEY